MLTHPRAADPHRSRPAAPGRRPGPGSPLVLHSPWTDLSDADRVRRLRERLGMVVAREPRVILDLREVEVADTKLVAVLVLLAGRARARGLDLTVRPSPCVRQLLRLCRLEAALSERSRRRRPGPVDMKPEETS